ncbi:MAG: prepilin-type N-terminal cleavage/methylation domain-containing protein [Candidatus Omnitrophota bacterium]|nr:MAG: prepilin-type N-terminal cleavage/methylation domain-containing protein [Candidatus Omnitrophota bacterium]
MKKSGFTLVEIMVVIAIVATIAAIAISSMLRSRLNANETIAIASCKTIGSACQSYFSTEDTYPSSLAYLAAPASNPPYIDDELAGGEKAGYEFTYEWINPVSFTLNAAPAYSGRTGERCFYTDETGIITYKKGAPAGPDDPAVQ